MKKEKLFKVLVFAFVLETGSHVFAQDKNIVETAIG